jgi:hypothetical protein
MAIGLTVLGSVTGVLADRLVGRLEKIFEDYSSKKRQKKRKSKSKGAQKK